MKSHESETAKSDTSRQRNKSSKYDEDANGAVKSHARLGNSYISHLQDTERERDRDSRIRKSRLVSPTSASSSPIPQNRLGTNTGAGLNTKLSPSEMSHFLADSSNRSYHSSQLINKENDTTASPSQFYGGETQGGSMIDSGRDRIDRNGYGNHHFHNRHAAQIDHYRGGKWVKYYLENYRLGQGINSWSFTFFGYFGNLAS